MKISRVVLYFVIVIFAFIFNFYLRPIKGNPNVDSEYKKSRAYVNDLYKSDEYFKKSMLDVEDYNMYYAVIDASIHDDRDITIPCGDRCSNFGLVTEAVMLDHPELISFRLTGVYSIRNNHTIHYQNHYNLSRIQTVLGTRRIEREMENIRRDTKNMTDAEKIVYVYDYVGSHPYDDIFMYNHSNQSAYSFFTKGSTVCAGFAKASQIIFQNIGIKSYLAFSNDHAWNFVEYKGKYYIFDATFGASISDKKSRIFYSGLGSTTEGEMNLMYEEYYPEIEKKPLANVIGLFNNQKKNYPIID